ncbi:hypothetical protein J9231_08075 [Providencia rettgeri]|uniref:hypothetical protein n=1 Tax=Providencia rettgeri TaxID=587 RepID=UPI001B36772B|nr:hypothetical protein [Providencia rettgeri]MBQ0327808.1 hypothetical protein [Providencia rettgeri]
MDKSRQQFEEFIKFHMNEPEPNNNLDKANNGLNYSDVGIDLMWISWQASRESFEVELPNTTGVQHTEYDNGYDGACQDIEEILISSGVKIKNE